MNKKNKTAYNDTLATEVINETTSKLVRLDDRIDMLLPDAKQIQAVLKAVRYAAFEGGISGDMVEYALNSVQQMVDVFCDNMEETSGISKAFVEEVAG